MFLNVINKKIFTILFLIVIFAIIAFWGKPENTIEVKSVISPDKILLENEQIFSFSEYDTFDSFYSNKNKEYAKIFQMTEDEAFIFGCFAKYWAKNILNSRKVKISSDDLIYYKFSYKTKFENSPYCITGNKVSNYTAFKKQLNTIRKGKFVVVDLDSDNIYPISKQNVEKLTNYVVVRRSHVKFNKFIKQNDFVIKDRISDNYKNNYSSTLNLENMKIVVSDSTTKLMPDRNCSSDICKEILSCINETKNTIDIAIYGYSSTPAIENAIKSAQNRGVKIRMVYDKDAAGNNIYPDTDKFVKLIPNSRSDEISAEVSNTMHNKFYIFDNKIVITGSANLSHTDMSGYNSNSIVVIKSSDAAKIYTKEFEQMYNGKFHNDKVSNPGRECNNIKFFFSPQDKAIANAVIPVIKNAKKYVYIPTFIITEKHVTEELINAHKRGVDVKIIVDALNASNKYSKHKVLRMAGIPVKAENYAGKMHSKTIIVDDEYLIIGSMNLSNSGENKNDENTVLIHNPEAAKFYRNFFLYQWNRIPEKWLKYIPRAEGKDSIGSCTDGIDNNYDGLTDMQDLACR